MSELHLGDALQACSEQVARMKAAHVRPWRLMEDIWV